jgi:hypothetical protein
MDLHAAGLVLDKDLAAAERSYAVLLTALHLTPYSAALLADLHRVAEKAGKMEDFVARRTKTAEGKIALAEAQAVADVRSAAANAAVAAASTILSQSVKGSVADDLLTKGIAEVRAKLN